VGTDAPRTTRHRGLKFLVGLLVTVLVLALVGVGLGWWTVQRSFPTTSGSITVPGVSEPVTVYRDDAGVPQIVAETDHDLFFAQGYVHAQDRFWEMDFRRHVTAGRLAELFGPSQVDTDAFVRTLDWRGIAQQEYDQLDDRTRAGFDAYADGVNAYLADHRGADLSLEYAVLGLQNPGYSPEPWSAVDSIAWLKAMAWDLRSNLVEELDRAILGTELPPEEVARLYPQYPFDAKPTIVGGPPPAAPAAVGTAPIGSSPGASVASGADAAASVVATPDGARGALRALRATLDDVPDLLGPEGGDLGSNSWVVGGALTESGKPLLANDPHLGPAIPSVWHQVGLHCATVREGCAYDVAGYSFSGLPGVIIGHNDRIAWGFTNLGPDVADLYYERVDGDSYELDGQMVPLTIREEVIEVAGGDPVTLTVRSTGRGPIVTDIGANFAAVADAGAAATGSTGDLELSLQWTALTPGSTAQSIFALDRARDWNEFRAAAELFDVPSQNLVYADVDGNIGYQAPGTIPVRKSGDGTVPLPGWTSGNGWAGAIPSAELPSVLNPARGYIVTANNAVADGGPMLTKDWDLGYRADGIERRLADLIGSGEKLTADDMTSIQLDTRDANAEAFLPVIAGLELDGDAARGQELLDGWNGHADADSAQAAYFAVFWRTLLATMFGSLPESSRPVGGDRWFSVVGTLLGEPDSGWWTDEGQAGVAGRDEMLRYALATAWKETSDRLGDDPESWRWGRLHTLELTNASFGKSGIGPIEWLFNRGPFETGGGSAIVNAIGWDATLGYEVNWVPSMRMVVDLGDVDASTWVNLTGASGHAFHPHYDDQARLWQRGETRPWLFGITAIADAAADTLQLRPGG
jgi:penicillin amidase